MRIYRGAGGYSQKDAGEVGDSQVDCGLACTYGSRQEVFVWGEGLQGKGLVSMEGGKGRMSGNYLEFKGSM